MNDQMLAVGQEPASLWDTTQQPALNGVRQVVILHTDLPIELNQLFGELLGHTGPEVLLREALRMVRSIRDPDVERHVGKARIDIDREVRPKDVILRLL